MKELKTVVADLEVSKASDPYMLIPVFRALFPKGLQRHMIDLFVQRPSDHRARMASARADYSSGPEDTSRYERR